MVNSSGCTVLLRGVNIPSLEWDTKGEGPPNGVGGDITQAVTHVIDNWRANIIRLPINQTRWMTYTYSYRHLVDNIISLASGRNAYVIVDLHRLDDYDDPATGASQTNAQSSLFWQDVKNRYRDNPAVIFGLYNEPHSISWGQWQTMYNGLLNVVRGTAGGAGATNMCMVGGLDWAFDLSGANANPLNDPLATDNLVYDVHYYPGKNLTQTDGVTRPRFFGEFGPLNLGDDNGAWDNAFINNGVNSAILLNNRGGSGAGWCFSTGAPPSMLTSWAGFVRNDYHGDPVRNWINGTSYPCGGAPTAYVAPTPTATPNTAGCFMLDNLEDGNLANATNGWWFTLRWTSDDNYNVTPWKSNVLCEGNPPGTACPAIVVVPNPVGPAGAYSAWVTGAWVTNGGGSPATYAGFGLATELTSGYTNWTNMQTISFNVKADRAPVTLRVQVNHPGLARDNFYWQGTNITGIGPGNMANNQYGFYVVVTQANVWQNVVRARAAFEHEDWGPGTYPPRGVSLNTALADVRSLQFNTYGAPTTFQYWIDNVCLSGMTNPTATPSAVGSTPTYTRTNTPTATPTRTSTRTSTSTNTPLANTSTPTRTNTSTHTSTRTSTLTPTRTSTNTPPANTSTSTRTNTSTHTSTRTSTLTPTRTSTSTNTPLANTSTPTRTNTATGTPTSTSTRTSTSTNTPVANTSTPTRTNTATGTSTSTSTRTLTATRTSTSSPTLTISPTFTNTGQPTGTSTSTPTRTNTGMPTSTSTSTATRTLTSTPTASSTSTSSRTPTSSSTHTNTRTLTASPTLTNTGQPTATNTNTTLNTSTATRTATASATLTSTQTTSPTQTATLTSTNTGAPTATSTSTRTPTTTSTQTATLTSTNTGAPTSTRTATATSTSTLANTLTSTRTATSSLTPTNTATSTSTPTSTSTATSTPLVLQVAVGPSSPSGGSALQGSSNVPVLEVRVTNPSGSSATLSSLTVTGSGSGNEATGVTTAALYRDNGDGVFNAGTDTLLSTGSFGADNGNVTFNFSTAVGAASTADLWVVYSFSATGAGNYQAGLANNAALTGTGAGQGLVFTGAPITSSTMAVVVATPTQTSTSTATATSTSTATPTATATQTSTPTISATPTLTPTATVQPGTTPIVFPNPISSGTVTILPQSYSGTSEVTVSIFTSAFKLVTTKVFPAVPAGQTVKVDLVDNWGEDLASGLFYVSVKTKTNKKTTSLIIVR